MSKSTLARLWVGLSLYVLSASLAYDSMLVGEVLAAGATEWSARRSGSEAEPTGVAVALASKPGRTSGVLSYAFADQMRVHAVLQIAWSKAATPASRPSGATVALVSDTSRRL